MLFGVIACVGRVLTACTHPTHVITPNSICAEPPEDERLILETFRGIDS
jgi:hypothetical protein